MLATILFPFVLVLDSFMTSIAYGANGIKVSKHAILIISFIGTLFLSCSLLFATAIKSFLPSLFSVFLSFLLFFLLGISNLLHFLFHNQKNKKKKIEFHWNHIHFVVDIYFDELKADLDNSLSLSSKEAVFLAVALSFDSLLSGFGIGLSNISIPLLLFLSFLLNFISITIGLIIGKALVHWNYDCSLIVSIIFFLLAFTKLFS